MNAKFFGTRLLVSDFKASVRFYREVLEMKEEWHQDEPGAEYALFSVGEAKFELMPKRSMFEALGEVQAEIGEAAPLHVVLDFGCEDVDAEVERLRARGVRFVTEPHDRPAWRARVAHFRDPEGNLFELYTTLPQ
ncbi:VOC family protein [Cohnella nanjingensis]|uniref:VOC family protein n=1 Tax=Cohnella nanjingensis TaxID=1387779 RepID=A0A7X0VHN3_9BACL|nr:VOC family protein [Cohnella nanjingensis]MBB6674332.1 VOC family protein [Cohnella nanjingensis]